MLQSGRRLCIRFCPEHECFKYKLRTAFPATADELTGGETTLRGLRPVLKRVCFPNYSYDASLRVGAKQFASQRKATGLTSPWQGRARGKTVQEQITLYVNHGRDAWVQQYTMSCSPYVDKFMRALTVKRLRPLVCEFEDFFEDLRIGSSIDLLCYDEKYDGLAVIEIKVGSENYFERGNAKLVRPASLRNEPNSPLNQAFLQLLVYRKMIADHYPFVKIARALVAQIKVDCIHFHALPEKFTAAADDLYAALARFPQSVSVRRRAGASTRGRRKARGT